MHVSAVHLTPSEDAAISGGPSVEVEVAQSPTKKLVSNYCTDDPFDIPLAHLL